MSALCATAKQDASRRARLVAGIGGDDVQAVRVAMVARQWRRACLAPNATQNERI